MNVALDFDLDLESGQIVALLHADLASRVGWIILAFFLLLYEHDGHAAG